MEKRYNVAVVTGTRAEYGLLRPLLFDIERSDALELRLLVTGAHLVHSLGKTVCEIELDGFSIAERIDILNDSEQTAQAAAMAAALLGFERYFKAERPSICVVLGDRYEAFSAAVAAAISGVPLAHISGGETTEGALDEYYRHCISKLSYLHFPSTEPYRKRIIQLGEDPARVVLAGSLGAQNIASLPLLSAAELGASIDFDLARPYLLVTWHPETLPGERGADSLGELLRAFEQLDMPLLVTKANADAGGAEINARLEAFCKDDPNRLLVSSLGALRYLSAMKHCAAVVGNSSSAIVESPTLKKPAVDIGDRQKGRIAGENTLHCRADAVDIVAAVKKAVSPAFAASIADTTSPYGGENASGTIAATITDYVVNNKIQLQKKFYDIDFEMPE